MAVPCAQDHAAAIVQQFHPGQSVETAFADVLFGDVSPSGKLPITAYRATDDLPSFSDYRWPGASTAILTASRFIRSVPNAMALPEAGLERRGMSKNIERRVTLSGLCKSRSFVQR